MRASPKVSPSPLFAWMNLLLFWDRQKTLITWIELEEKKAQHRMKTRETSMAIEHNLKYNDEGKTRLLELKKMIAEKKEANGRWEQVFVTRACSIDLRTFHRCTSSMARLLYTSRWTISSKSLVSFSSYIVQPRLMPMEQDKQELVERLKVSKVRLAGFI